MKALLLLVWLLGGLAACAAGKPNLVIILADDLGYGDPGCYGGTLVPTPAIDSLARNGVRCTAGYVTAPICAPSRCGIMTGSYNQRFGIQWNEDQFWGSGRSYSIPATHKLLPETLKTAGYVTGHIGKWNVGADVRGRFDEACDVMDWAGDYFPDGKGHYVGVDSDSEHGGSKREGLWGPERPGDEYLTDRIGRHAVEFIEKSKRGDKPFFLYLAFNAVHTPYQAKKELATRFSGLKPPFDFYAAMIASLDENIGRVLAALPDNTLVVFTSDNGPAYTPDPVWPTNWPLHCVRGSAGPFSGHKGQFLEGGIREPFLLQWQGRLKAGVSYHQPVSTMDLYATFCAAAGVAVPAGTRIDGVNLLPYLQGGRQGAPHDILFWKNGDGGAVRKGDWKLLISRSEPKLQLFNLAEDGAEKHDLAGEKPELVTMLRQAWLDWSGPLPPRANPPVAKSPTAKPARGRAASSAQEPCARSGKSVREIFLPREEYNMPLEPKGRIIAGAGQGSMDSFLQYSRQVDSGRYPGLYMDYTGLDHPPGKLEKRVQGWNTLKPGTLIQLGLSMTHDGDPKLHYEHKVASGEMDARIDHLIKVLKGTQHPILVRIGYEFNGRWNGYEPESYRKAYRRVAARLRAGLGRQVAFAWCFSLDDKKNDDFMSYFPGDDVVDWWSVDVFGEGNFTHKALKPFLQAARQHRRPVLIGECTPRHVPVQLGEESVRRWFKPFFALLAENPGIKAFSYIYWDWSKTRWSDWGDGRFGENPVVKAYFNAQLQDPIFAPMVITASH